MADENLEDIKKLSPGKRIEKLKELEAKRKQEIEETERLIKESVNEIKQEQELAEQIAEEERRQKEEIETPKNSDLEHIVQEEKDKISDEANYANTQYQIKLSMEPISSLYTRVKEVYNEVRERGEMTEEQAQQITNLSYAMQSKEEAIDSGKYRTTGEQIENILSASKSILHYMNRG